MPTVANPEKFASGINHINILQGVFFIFPGRLTEGLRNGNNKKEYIMIKTP